MKQIVFDGYLKEMYPEGIRVDASTAAEAISGLGLYPGFREEDGVRHTVVLPQFQSRDSLYERTDEDTILVVPVVLGAGGGGGMFQVVIGAVLVVAGTYFQQPWMVKMGYAMMVSGAIQMLMPAPEVRSGSEDSAKSNYMPANKNTTKVGTRIALLFGRRKVWGHILTFNITASNMPAPAAATNGAGSWVVSNSMYQITAGDAAASGSPATGPGEAGPGGGNGGDTGVGDGSGSGGPGF